MKICVCVTYIFILFSVQPSVNILKPPYELYQIKNGEELALVCRGHGDPMPTLSWRRQVYTVLWDWFQWCINPPRGMLYMKKMANFMLNSNLLSEILNGLSHILYQIKKYKNYQIYDMFGIFGIISENIVNNKSGNPKQTCLLLFAWRPLAPVNKGRNNFCPCLLVRGTAVNKLVAAYRIYYYWYSPKLHRKSQTCHIFDNFCIF